MERLNRFLVLGIILVMAGCAIAPRQHGEFTDNEVSVKKIVVLPAEIDVVEKNFKGDVTQLDHEIVEVAGAFQKSYDSKLKEKGYSVKFVTLEDLQQLDPEISYKLEQFRKAYQTQMGEMSGVSGTSKKKALYTDYNVGETLFELTQHLEGDALMLVDFNAFRKSKGQAAKDFAGSVLFAVATGGNTYVSNNFGSHIQIGLVDMSTGNILWSISTVGQSKDFTKAVSQPLKFFPKHDDNKAKYKYYIQ